MKNRVARFLLTLGVISILFAQIPQYDNDQARVMGTTISKLGEIPEEGNNERLSYRPFFPHKTLPEGVEETSPSFTGDGQTIVFARYEDWAKKVPFIAYFVDGRWKEERLSFVDTLYNLAISPNGSRIIYKTVEEKDGKEISHCFVVDKLPGAWSTPLEIKSLYNIHAGYFHLMKDGTLYFFARSPKSGIYYSGPDETLTFGSPQWLSDAVSLENSDSFDICMHPDSNKLIVTQYYSEKKFPERGEIGMYYYEKIGDDWKRIKRLPLDYAWGASVTPDNKFVFVRKGTIQYVLIENLGIRW
ncbi:MAG: hypothetical protein AAGA10_27620 [Bacteroidota bacterium]